MGCSGFFFCFSPVSHGLTAQERSRKKTQGTPMFLLLLLMGLHPPFPERRTKKPAPSKAKDGDGGGGGGGGSHGFFGFYYYYSPASEGGGGGRAPLRASPSLHPPSFILIFSPALPYHNLDYENNPCLKGKGDSEKTCLF
nr:hypothetical protein [Morchella crassipes]